MKKILAVSCALMMLMGLTTVASAYTITTASVLGDGGYTSIYAGLSGTELNTFDGTDQNLWTLSGTSGENYSFVTGSTTKNTAPSYVDASNTTQSDTSTYLSVPTTAETATSTTVTNLGGTYNYLGLWWGTIDTYNTITLYLDGKVVAVISGSDIVSNADGTVSEYVNLYDLPTFDSFSLTSTSYAFEADNIVVANNVPEPGTLVLLGVGLLSLAVYGKRRMNKEA